MRKQPVSEEEIQGQEAPQEPDQEAAVPEEPPKIDYVKGMEYTAKEGRLPGAFGNLPGETQAVIRIVAYGFLAVIQTLKEVLKKD